jgi:hypothetical protein
MRKAIFVIGFVIVAATAYLLFFSPKEKSPAEAGFSETGNLTIADGGVGTWNIVYEKPGAPALSAVLSFDESSLCYEDDENKACSDIIFQEGRRASVSGYLSDGTVSVSELRLDPIEENGMRQVDLFYYDPDKDRDGDGNIMCGREGLVPVEVFLPEDNVIENAIKLLIRGEVPEKAASEGVMPEFPLEGLTLKNSSLEGGTLTLVFEDPNNRTSGGSCRTGILWFQIEKTAKQFSGVDEVRFLPEHLFQP